MLKRRHLTALLALLGLAALALWICKKSLFRTEVHSQPVPRSIRTSNKPRSQTYRQAQTKIEAERNALFSSYNTAETALEKSAVLDRAREALIHSAYVDLLEFWYGTPWDFYGTTETPGQGKIACGYFVTTVLRDLGLKVQRAKLAQQASENIILTLTTDDHIKRYRLKHINDFVEDVRKAGPGIYIVGLDIHVGFIINVDDEVYFIHSSYMDPLCVIKERALQSKILIASKYRVLGKISADDELILKWLRGDQFMTRVS
jgi:hypothetical protein